MATQPAIGKDQGPAAAAGPSMKQTFLAAGVVTAIAAGMGALFALPAPSAQPIEKDETAAATRPPPAAGYFDLPPIVTNIGGPGDTWVRLEASIVYDIKALPHPEVTAAEIAADELAYLRTATLAQIEGPIGLQNIRQDLNERAAIRSSGKVTELIVRTLVVQ
jgi:flagellar protein FliL